MGRGAARHLALTVVASGMPRATMMLGPPSSPSERRPPPSTLQPVEDPLSKEIDRPDRVIFDMGPGEGYEWAHVKGFL